MNPNTQAPDFFLNEVPEHMAQEYVQAEVVEEEATALRNEVPEHMAQEYTTIKTLQ